MFFISHRDLSLLKSRLDGISLLSWAQLHENCVVTWAPLIVFTHFTSASLSIPFQCSATWHNPLLSCRQSTKKKNTQQQQHQTSGTLMVHSIIHARLDDTKECKSTRKKRRKRQLTLSRAGRKKEAEKKNGIINETFMKALFVINYCSKLKSANTENVFSVWHLNRRSPL